MKIAVLLPGRIKKITECCDNWHHVFNMNKNEVYFYNYDWEENYKFYTDEEKNTINKLCKIVKIENFEENNTITDPWLSWYGEEKIKLSNVKYFLSLKKVFELFEQNENINTFDLVVKYRPDIKTKDKFNFVNPKNCVFIPSELDFEGINDQIAYGSPDVMKKYCANYDNYQKVAPERNLLLNLQLYNIPVKRFRFNYKLADNRVIDK
jgi:hypothetical protein